MLEGRIGEKEVVNLRNGEGTVLEWLSRLASCALSQSLIQEEAQALLGFLRECEVVSPLKGAKGIVKGIAFKSGVRKKVLTSEVLTTKEETRLGRELFSRNLKEKEGHIEVEWESEVGSRWYKLSADQDRFVFNKGGNVELSRLFRPQLVLGNFAVNFLVSAPENGEWVEHCWSKEQVDSLVGDWGGAWRGAEHVRVRFKLECWNGAGSDYELSLRFGEDSVGEQRSISLVTYGLHEDSMPDLVSGVVAALKLFLKRRGQCEAVTQLMVAKGFEVNQESTSVDIEVAYGKVEVSWIANAILRTVSADGWIVLDEESCFFDTESPELFGAELKDWWVAFEAECENAVKAEKEFRILVAELKAERELLENT